MNLKDDRKDEFLASLALIHTRGLGCKRCKTLIEFYGSARNAVSSVKSWVQDLSFPKEVIKNFLNNSWKELVENEINSLKKIPYLNVLLYSDPLYPSLLKEIPDPPIRLYFIGNPELLKRNCIAVVGSRTCSFYGKEISFDISKDLSSYGICVVSGFAVGIDRQAHLGAIEEVGRTIAVLGCGLDIIYPSRNKDLWEKLKGKGLILTEFPPKTPPEAVNFPRRNRIISGLSIGVVVIEAKEKSGSLITASLGLEQGRIVFAVPSSARSSYQGTNKLLREGAVLVTSAKEVIEEIPFLLEKCPSVHNLKETTKTPSLDLKEEERKVFDLLGQYEKLHIDEISKKLNWSSCKASEILLVLELKGIVTQLPGMFYMLKLV